jgi:hypothetical protein
MGMEAAGFRLAAETLVTLRPATAAGVGDQRLAWAEELAASAASSMGVTIAAAVPWR